MESARIFQTLPPSRAEEPWVNGVDAVSSTSGPLPETTQPTSEIHEVPLQDGSGRNTDAGAGLSATGSTVSGSPCTCHGVDMPGVGVRHLSSCPMAQSASGSTHGPAVARGRAYVAGETPEALHRFLDEECGDLTGASFDAVERARIADSAAGERKTRRDELLTHLLIAARIKAQRDLQRVPNFADRAGVICAECKQFGVGAHVEHLATCGTGRILGVLADLCETVASNRKEAAAGGEVERAGDGILSRVPGVATVSDICDFSVICGRCAERNRSWLAAAIEQAGAPLRMNQIGLIEGSAMRVYTHCCPDLSANLLKAVMQCEGGAL